MSTAYVVMGVSGCGKSRIGAGFATAIGAQFIDGDSLHPQANVDKMARGEPLNDADRHPWLKDVGRHLGPNTVIACSALKRSYRDLIRETAGAPVIMCLLHGTRAVLWDRVSNRAGHFMPPALLDSQLATLELPTSDEPHVIADIGNTPDHIIKTLIAATKELAQ
ncbi:MAG: gluconokinase [Tateyamaria sp.]|uniref:gluconokinase n=1 Tax=Tateyamaria sp. TaxID=1929288 RepID=UPI00329D23BE